MLPEGLIAKFDLLWFVHLARYAKLRWADRIPDPKVAQECDAQLQKRLPSLFHKILKTMAVPKCSPAANLAAKQGSAGREPEAERRQLPFEHELLLDTRRDGSSWK